MTFHKRISCYLHRVPQKDLHFTWRALQAQFSRRVVSIVKVNCQSSSMLRFRSVRGNHWIEVNTVAHPTVRDAKSVIVADLPGTDISKLKLVFRGRILSDHEYISLSSLNISPGEYVVYQPRGCYGAPPPLEKVTVEPAVELESEVEAPPPDSFQTLVEMGFQQDLIGAALRASNGKLERALDLLMRPGSDQLTSSELEVVRKRIVKDPTCFVMEMKRLLDGHNGRSPADERIRDGITNHIEEFLASMWLNPRALPIGELKKALGQETTQVENDDGLFGKYDLPEMVEKANVMAGAGFDPSDAALALRMTGYNIKQASALLLTKGLTNEDRDNEQEMLRDALRACPEMASDFVFQHILAIDHAERGQFFDLKSFLISIGLNPGMFNLDEIRSRIASLVGQNSAVEALNGPLAAGFPGMPQAGFGTGPVPSGFPGFGTGPAPAGFPGMPQAGFGTGPMPQGGPSTGSWGNSRR